MALSIANSSSSAVLDRIREIKPDRVVISNSERSYRDFPGVGPDYDKQWAAGLESLLDGLPAGSEPVIIGDNPSWQQSPNSCVSKNLKDPDRCAVNRADSYSAALQTLERDAVRPVEEPSWTPWICSATSLCARPCTATS